MLIKILIALAAISLAFVVVVSNRPSEFSVTRSAVMSAPASVIFAQVNDLRKWEAWSPWAKLDPAAKSTFAGPAAGPGAKMSWVGNMKIGEGSMTITDSRPNDHVRFRLDFLKPMAGADTAEFTFQPKGKQTLVTWTMSGQNNFMSKAIGLVMDCDKIVGGQFEKGLVDLKAIVESPAKK
jgi:hypothetical protein